MATLSAQLARAEAAKMTPAASGPGSDQGLIEHYKRWFDIVPANTPELLEAAYRLRYEVYCLETGFEDKDQFPDGLEWDEYDERSVTSLLIHKPTGKIAGTIRLILPDASAVDAPALPASKVSADLAGMIPEMLPRATTAEISRFTISKDFRKRREDGLLPAVYEVSGRPGDQRVIPHIALGLMQSVLRMSIENDITHLCMLIEPALDRLVRKLGLYFTPVGPIVQYHGRRRAYYCENIAMAADIYRRRPEIWNFVADGGKMWPIPR